MVGGEVVTGHPLVVESVQGKSRVKSRTPSRLPKGGVTSTGASGSCPAPDPVNVASAGLGPSGASSASKGNVSEWSAQALLVAALVAPVSERQLRRASSQAPCTPPAASKRGTPAGTPKATAATKTTGTPPSVASRRVTPAGTPMAATPSRTGTPKAARATKSGIGNGIEGHVELRSYIPDRVLGKGAFGVVYQATVQETGEVVAIKITALSHQRQDRELQILKELHHHNIVALKGAFMTGEAGDADCKMNLVLECCKETLNHIIQHARSPGERSGGLQAPHVKLYSYQMFRGLSYIHSKAICHRDVKPQNLLVTNDHVLKICDFGTAKRFVYGEANRAYVCSRYYRAPELILGAACYTTAIDLWSGGCVVVEMVLGFPLFMGKDGVDQLVEIIKVLGTPSASELQAMNPKYPAYEFQAMERIPWSQALQSPSLLGVDDLVGELLRYDPMARCPPLHICMHTLFDELRTPAAGGKPRSDLFDFSEEELLYCLPEERGRLLPVK